MTTSNGHPQPLPVGAEPPPLTPAPSRAKEKPKGKPTGERFKTLNAFIDFTLADLSRAELAVWLILYRDTRDGTARTGYDDLARRAGMNRRSVGRALRRLVERGLVQVVYRGGFRRGLSRYRVRALGT